MAQVKMGGTTERIESEAFRPNGGMKGFFLSLKKTGGCWNEKNRILWIVL